MCGCVFYTAPVWREAHADGYRARLNGEPRDPAPYLPKYGDWRGAQTPGGFWLQGWDAADEAERYRRSRPTFRGQDLWQPVPPPTGSGGSAAGTPGCP